MTGFVRNNYVRSMWVHTHTHAPSPPLPLVLHFSRMFFSFFQLRVYSNANLNHFVGSRFFNSSLHHVTLWDRMISLDTRFRITNDRGFTEGATFTRVRKYPFFLHIASSILSYAHPLFSLSVQLSLFRQTAAGRIISHLIHSIVARMRFVSHSLAVCILSCCPNLYKVKNLLSTRNAAIEHH